MMHLTDHLRDALFRRVRPLPGGQMLLRWGQSFYIVDAGRLKRLQQWREIYLAVLICSLFVLIGATVLWARSVGTEPPSGAASFAIIVGLLFVGIDLWMNRHRHRCIQPRDDHDRLTEIWDGMG